MTVAESYQDYVVLRLQGFTKEEALSDLSTYLHPIALARLKKHVAQAEATAQEPQSKPRRAK